jgi:UDP-3-O-[3-hydroxymyristoyl] glucosamine N-acyltransferase
MPVMTVREIAELIGGTPEGDTTLPIESANSIDLATEHQLSFATGRKALQLAGASRAGCLLVPLEYENNLKRTVIRVPEPRAAFARVLSVLYAQPSRSPAIHPTAVIAVSAELGTGCAIGAHVVIGESARIGDSCRIAAGCVIENGVQLGDFCILHPNTTIYEGVRIGNRVILHAGCVVGADGFGFAFSNGRYEKFPQIGTVEIGDDVELGANTCIDRAALGVTHIGEGTKIDNLAHIAHNCTIGKHVVIAAQTGLSGGVTVGDYAVIGGQVGVGDKATIEPRSVVGSGAGILTSKIVRAGEPVWGTPARPLREHLKQLAAIGRLPETLREWKELRQQINAGRHV